MTHSLNDIRTAFLNFFGTHGHEVMPSGSLVPHNDPTLMFTNAGMVPFKNYFTGAEKAPVARAASSQKCVRAGGKHNDLDNVGYTARHHTFFEMLGNFSFGDYFKEGAIEYAWEFLTRTIGLPEEKLFFTVYHTDDDAFALWKKITGVPEEKILRVPTKDNFWAMGDTGPCGPCSEIFYDHGTGKGEWKLDNDGYDLFGERYVEIWNLVFMQFESHADGSQTDLPKPSIDTGMGLERMAAILQGKHDNYDIDLFQHLIRASEAASGNASPDARISHRVITDHLRSCSFLIADGVMPSNEGRGYVLRRIMRRAMRHAHILGCTDPLMYRLIPALIKEMGDHYPELKRAEPLITETLKLEEERFKETLDRGLKLLEEKSGNLKKGGKLPGQTAFKLYDTYGFPLDLTQDILRGKGMEVDMSGFEAAMDEQKAKARAAWKGSGEQATEEVWFDIHEQRGATEFLGYETTKGNGKVIAIIKDGKFIDSADKSLDEVLVVTNQTPFYAESGGQAGDKGEFAKELESNFFSIVRDTQKKLGAIHVHTVTIPKGKLAVGDEITMIVDIERRNALRANHSATHLLHAVLRKHLGDHVTQKGSLVEEDYFRFDFSHPKAVSKEELQAIENEVNTLIRQGSDVDTRMMTPDEAVEQGAMALFGEKYGDEVRVVSMGDGYSIELCGGTHVCNTGDIGKLKIIRESSVASGIRRIEAKTGEAVDQYLKEKQQEREAEAARKKAAEAEAAEQASQVSGVREQFIKNIKQAETIGDITFYGASLEGVNGKDLRGFADDFKKQAGSGIVVIVAGNEGKASIVVGVTDDLTGQYSAVDLVRVGSEALGGKGGGGRPDFAQAGGPDVSKAEDAIGAVKATLAD